MRREWPLLVSVVTMGLFLVFGKGWLADLSGTVWFTSMLACDGAELLSPESVRVMMIDRMSA